MPLFGLYTQSEVEAMLAGARLSGQQSKTDHHGRDADGVWRLWTYECLRRGEDPPLFAPTEIIEECRRELEARNA